MTANLGQGGNNAIESVASLVNQLHALLVKKAKQEAAPTMVELEAAFAAYQGERYKKVKRVAGLTGDYTRWTSQQGWFGWFVLSRVWPLVGDGFVANRLLTPMIKESVKLDFVEEEHLPAGKVAWKFP